MLSFIAESSIGLFLHWLTGTHSFSQAEDDTIILIPQADGYTGSAGCRSARGSKLIDGHRNSKLVLHARAALEELKGDSDGQLLDAHNWPTYKRIAVAGVICLYT